MRKWIAVLLAVLLLIGGATSALAAEKWTLPPNSSWEGNVLVVETFQTSALTGEYRAWFEDWVEIFKGNAPGKVMIIYEIDAKYVYFLRISDSVSDNLLSQGSVNLSVSKYPYINFANLKSVPFSILAFDGSSAGPVYFFKSIYSTLTPTMTNGFNMGAILYANFTLSSNWNDYYVTKDHLELGVDDDIFGSPGPEPEPSEPDPPPRPPTIPEIPSIKNEYIPYDTTKWNGFLKWVTTAIGNSTNIGWVIFGIIMGILIVIKVVKHFSKG